MSLDLSTIGFKTEPHVFNYEWKTAVLYALGIGAKRAELEYLYEGGGPKVFPTFGVIPAYGPVSELFGKTRCDMTRLVHGAQSLRVHRTLPASGTLHSVGTVRGIYDMKRLAQIVLATNTTLNGEPCFETEWQLLVRDAGNFGGERPPKSDTPKIPDGKTPDFEHSETTSPEQALLYRLSGDLNPLHADPAFAAVVGFDQPILHGLCTYGFVARAVIHEACGGDASKLKGLTVQFRKPVWPGDTIRTMGYALSDGRIALQAFASDRPDAVITSAFAEI